MRLAETVTFGGSALDRAAQLRGDTPGLDRMAREGGACILPLWRGKPLISDTGPGETPGLGWIAADSPALVPGGERLFLGRDDGGQPRFAIDLSAWEPEALPDTLGSFVDPSRQHHPDLPQDLAFAELRGVMASLTPRDAELAATARAMLGWHASHGFCAACGHPTDMAKAGWQRDCPACGAHHFPRTDPVVIMLITRGNQVLVGRSPGWPERMFSLLAGFVEPGETIEAAVRREVFEETGVRIGRVDYLASQPWPFPASLMIGCHGLAESDEITIDPAEIEQARWVTREEMMEVFAGTHPDMDPARNGAIARFLLAHWLADRLD